MLLTGREILQHGFGRMIKNLNEEVSSGIFQKTAHHRYSAWMFSSQVYTLEVLVHYKQGTENIK
ncbi:hypothetical protein OIU74_020717 [Salix koriyanagi]|uniref:Uncharacterized protein n=1 Tax=Salix koriyanagi TaxID=2511006 RepID=A0A9Q0P6S8_9ROSI|nr:hypothetical protein OIU74_020717 [Salix koriyanagi]